MNELMNNPAFQSGVLPFLVALVMVWVLRGLGWVWSGLGFAAGYFATVYMVMGIPHLPLTSSRKIVVLGAAAVLVGLLLDALIASRRVTTIFLSALTAAAGAVWLIWPVMARSEGQAFWSMLAASSLYAAWMAVAMTGQRSHAPAATMAALGLGLGTGLSAILGASALLGQLGIAVAAAAGACAIPLLFGREISLGCSFTLPVSILSALVGIAAVVYASLPWYSLLPLMLVPLLVNVPLPGGEAGFRRMVLPGLMAMAGAGAAVALTWWQAGPPSF